ncbi:zinc finger protein [Macleaya cordata]|uniref:Zinc finger protein n=1 Tax=Macleaya cordata TaxID=56857 RepID=A0A200R9F7_MACCD|nr:zinc finger protein [Macleaya cordata]
MATDEVSKDVHDHGTTLDRKRQKVRCNYCAKVVTGKSRLKQHLGGVRGDVVPCVEVPEDVKVQMRNSLLERMKERNEGSLSKEVLQLFDSDIPPKRNSCSSNSTERNWNHLESIQPTLSRKRKHIMVDSSPEKDEKQHVLFPRTTLDSHTVAKSEKVENDSLRQAQRIRSAMPFLALEKIVCQKENLENLFTSSAWNSSTWASTADGRKVASGLLCCIVRMVEDKRTQDLIVVQLDDYRAANGAFGKEVAVDQRTKIPPVSNKDYSDIFLEEIDPMDEWVGGGEVKEMAQAQLNCDDDDDDDSGCRTMDNGCGDKSITQSGLSKEEGASGFKPKKEPFEMVYQRR